MMQTNTNKLFPMMKKNRFEFLLAAILIAGLAIRLYGINWDQGFSYSPHPTSELF